MKLFRLVVAVSLPIVLAATLFAQDPVEQPGQLPPPPPAQPLNP